MVSCPGSFIKIKIDQKINNNSTSLFPSSFDSVHSAQVRDKVVDSKTHDTETNGNTDETE